MQQSFIIEYWNDDDWWVGRLKGIPGVFSQGQTLEELEENIRDAYQLMNIEAEPAPAEVKTKDHAFNKFQNFGRGRPLCLPSAILLP